MGKCKYCGRDAGFLRSKHDECERRFNRGVADIKQILALCFASKQDFYLKDAEIKRIASGSYITGESLTKVFCEAFDEAVDQYLEDGLIDAAEERTVARFVQYSGLPQNRLNANHSLEKVVQSKVLQDILQGKTPVPRITIKGDFPFMLSKTEHLIWLSRNVTLYQQKVRREYSGRTRGLSFRIMKGVYYRTGGFKGHPVETTYMQKTGTGSVCLTDKNLYFASPEKSLKIPYDRILSLESFSNGISIQKDGANDKPFFLEGISSWFTYNVIANLK